MIITMAANADSDIVKSKLNLIISVGLGPRWKASVGFSVCCLRVLTQEDEYLAKYSCIAVQKLRKKATKGELQQDVHHSYDCTDATPSAPSISRLPNDHLIFEKLCEVVTERSISHSKW